MGSLTWWRGENRILSRGIGGSNFGGFPRLPRSRWSPETLLCRRLQPIPGLDGYRPLTERSALGRHVRCINLREPVVVKTHIATVFAGLSLSRHPSTARCSRIPPDTQPPLEERLPSARRRYRRGLLPTNSLSYFNILISEAAALRYIYVRISAVFGGQPRLRLDLSAEPRTLVSLSF